jgi:hypothetical protein
MFQKSKGLRLSLSCPPEKVGSLRLLVPVTMGVVDVGAAIFASFVAFVRVRSRSLLSFMGFIDPLSCHQLLDYFSNVLCTQVRSK